MTEAIQPLRQLLAVVRRKQPRIVSRSVPLSDLPQSLAEGWTTLRQGKRIARVGRDKPADVWLTDRVWMLLYRLGFSYLTGEDGLSVSVAHADGGPQSVRFETVAVDDEAVIAAITMVGNGTSRRKAPLAKFEIHARAREPLLAVAQDAVPSGVKRVHASVIFTQGVLLSDDDRRRAGEQGFVLMGLDDLEYYESLVRQLGQAARYQFLADALTSRRIPGLALRVPALKTRMGEYTCFTFSATPEYLLKIGYVSHRARGGASDVMTYQRMIQRSRIGKIRQYIEDGGMFPTNIVINFEVDRPLRFDLARQEGTQEDITYGWLSLPEYYRSAWIIDGQHRLYAYSGLARATSSVLTILAFERLPPNKQAELFIDINAEQKSVPRALLQELYGDLHQEAAEPTVRIRAVISKAIQALDQAHDSALFGRVRMTGESRSPIRCITFTSLFGALNRSGTYFSTVRRGSVVEYGALWAGSNSDTILRTVRIIGAWFSWVQELATAWWDLGSDPGGGLAMSDGVSICIDVLRSVFTHLEGQGHRLARIDDRQMVRLLEPYGRELGEYLGGLDAAARKNFRELRGNEGHAAGVRRCEAALQRRFPEFDPPGLKKDLELEKAQTSQQARELIVQIEQMLQLMVLSELRAEYGDDEHDWWFKGVPIRVRQEVDKRINEDQGQRGGRPENLDLIHYREIALENFRLFQGLLARGKHNTTKQDRTAWIMDVNEIRKSAMHASRRTPITFEQLGQLQEYEGWLRDQFNRVVGGETTDDDEVDPDAE